MATIRSMVEDKLRQKDESISCGRVREILRKMLSGICKSLPDGTLVGDEFAKAISKSLDHAGTDPIDMLVEVAIEERDDFCEYPQLRHKLECAIKHWK